MGTGNDSTGLPPSSRVAAAGLDHVRLSYHYLDGGDIDGYASLLDQGAVLLRPCSPPLRGRPEVERFRAQQVANAECTHTLFDVFASGNQVAAVGHFAGDTPRGSQIDVDFAEIFTLSDSGLLLSQKTFFFADPHCRHNSQ